MDKIEKLKEINKQINEICIDLETKLFLEDIDIDEKRIVKQYKPESDYNKKII